jgi:hypothetical protein
MQIRTVSLDKRPSMTDVTLSLSKGEDRGAPFDRLRVTQQAQGDTAVASAAASPLRSCTSGNDGARSLHDSA